MNEFARTAGDRAASQAQVQPLRESLLLGAYFGAAHRVAAARMAEFPHLSTAEALRAWFGADVIHFARDLDVCRSALDRDIAAIDDAIGEQLDAILHHRRLRRFEGSWRGMAWLVGGLEPQGRVKVKVLNLSWADLCRDFERALEFDQSEVFRKIYESEFGTPGGEPYGVLLVDHEVRHRLDGAEPGDDVMALAQLSAVAAAAFAPTVLAASPHLFGVDAFTELGTATDFSDPFRGAEFARWRSLSNREDMRFIAVTLPRLLARAPWQDDPARADGFRYEEYAPEAADRVWMTAVWGFGAVVARAFARHAWPADVRGAATDYIGGGLVTDRVWVRPPLDLVISDRVETALLDAGLMPLSALPYSEEAVFSATRSLQAPASFIGENAAAATANARLSTQLNSMLCVSRFAHYVKILGREMVGSFRTASEIERQLQAWLNGYVNSSPSAGPEMRARYPLVAAQVSVRERPGRPGVFGCIVRLQPHFQLDDVAASFRLVTDIAAPGAPQ
jgi:type VI secretion system ImpC/EvpB family protein